MCDRSETEDESISSRTLGPMRSLEHGWSLVRFFTSPYDNKKGRF
jgi:hypothetical protein